METAMDDLPSVIEIQGAGAQAFGFLPGRSFRLFLPMSSFLYPALSMAFRDLIKLEPLSRSQDLDVAAFFCSS